MKKTFSLLLAVAVMLIMAVSAGAADSLRGDADGDGKVTILDATRIQRYLASMASEEEVDMQAADADLDGKVTILDATRIQRVLANLCDMDGRTPADEPDPTEPIIPRITTVSSSNNGAEIKWSAVEGAEGYRVFIKNGDGWKRLGDTTATSFTHTDAPIGVECVYTVRCISADGKSFTSDYDHDGYRNTRLASPVLKSAKLIDGYVALDWEDTAGAEVYRVFIKGGDYKSWTRLGDTDFSYVDMPNALFTSDTVYSFTIRCVDPEDDTRLLSGFDTKGVSVHFYDMPEIYYAENTEDGMILYWTECAGAAQYRLYLETWRGWETVCDTAETGAYLTGVSADSGEYRFTVAGLDAKGNVITARSDSGFTYRFKEPDDYFNYNLLSGDYCRSFLWERFVDQIETYGFVPVPDEYDGEPFDVVLLFHTACYGDKTEYIMFPMKNDGMRRLGNYLKMLERNGVEVRNLYYSLEEIWSEDTGDFGYYFVLYQK